MHLETAKAVGSVKDRASILDRRRPWIVIVNCWFNIELRILTKLFKSMASRNRASTALLVLISVLTSPSTAPEPGIALLKHCNFFRINSRAFKARLFKSTAGLIALIASSPAAA
jgi:hypothetical protein